MKNIFVLGSLVLCGAASAHAVTNDWQWSGGMRRGQLIEIRGVDGDVRAELSNDDHLSVTAEVSGEDSNHLRDVPVRLVEHAGGVTICAASKDEAGCRNPESGTAGDSRINFVVHVPRGVNLVARTVNGKVEASSLEGDVEAYTINGGIAVSTTGSVRAHSVNGSINAALLRAERLKPSAISTVNGAINLSLPETSRTLLRAETKNGSIVSAIPHLKGRVGEHKLVARLGNGSLNSLQVTTTNGRIQLEAAQ